MTIQISENGQYFVVHENLCLTQTVIDNMVFNDCSIYKGTHYLLCSSKDEVFRPLFLALVDFKNNLKNNLINN